MFSIVRDNVARCYTYRYDDLVHAHRVGCLTGLGLGAFLGGLIVLLFN